MYQIITSYTRYTFQFFCVSAGWFGLAALSFTFSENGILRSFAYLLTGVGIAQAIPLVIPYLPKQIISPAQWIHAQVFETFVFLAVPIWCLATMFRTNKTKPQPLHGCPILLVHGYLNSGCVWDIQKARLAKKGYTPIYTIDLGSPFSSIKSHARSLQKKVKEIAQETGTQQIHLIGHSMGGVVSAYYALTLAPKNTVKTVITLGSPLHGTHMALLGLGASARDMRRGSHFISELEDLFLKSSDHSFYHIGTKTDQIVVPYTSSFLGSDPARQCLFDDLGHASLLFSPRVTGKIYQWINESNCRK